MFLLLNGKFSGVATMVNEEAWPAGVTTGLIPWELPFHLFIYFLIYKEMPPIRLIASSRNGPTYKLGKWLSGILTPLSIEYCGEEYIRDSAHFLTKLNNQSYPPDKEGLCFTVDVNKLYPSITETVVMESLDHALPQSKISVPGGV